MLNISECMKRTIKNKNLEVAEIAKKTGMSKSTIHDLENGTTANPTIKTIARLCEGIEISVDEFLYGEKKGKIQTFFNKFKELEEEEQETLLTMYEGARHAVSERKKKYNIK
ncbi:helix-turn-helix domain-containing protein [Psychrobacter aquimaris]|uniref:helix-turn-helix domain-containing protein n=1 Tax=Psychrobacter aquimaris TaxID=292733 RepID=UPI003FCF9543